MNFEEIATKADLAEMERRIIQALSSKKLEKDKPLDMDEAADYIHAKRSTLYKLTAAGEIAYHKSGKKNVFRIADLDRYLASRRKSSIEEIKEKANSRRS